MNSAPSGGGFLLQDISPDAMLIPEDFTEEHRLIFKTANDFVRKEVLPRIDDIERMDETLIRSLLAQAGELGLLGTAIPEEFGGLNLDTTSTCLVAEALGRGFSFAVTFGNHTGIASMPIVLFGTPEQQEKYLPRLASGEWMGAYCLTEPNAGSDALNARTRATLTPDGSHYLLNGEKIFITNAAWADSFIVYAKVDGTAFTSFIVERSFPGISFGPEERKMGIKGSSTRAVVFTDCPVPVENVLGGVGQGHKVAFNTLNIGRFKLGAFAMGASKKCVGEAARYANQRVQFGKPISSFGLIGAKLADMTIRSFIMESIQYRVAGMLDDRVNASDTTEIPESARHLEAAEEFAIEASICKVLGSEIAGYCMDEWVQILGGYGYCAEFPAERGYRDARINRIFEGTNEINRLLIPGTLYRRALTGRFALTRAVQDAARALAELPQGERSPKEGLLAEEQHLLSVCKNLTVTAMAAAAEKFMAQISDEQEILALLADMIMDVLAMESGLLRALRCADLNPGPVTDLMAAAVTVYQGDTVVQVARRANKIRHYVAGGSFLPALDAGIRYLALTVPPDSINLRRTIAAHVKSVERYPFGIPE